MATNEDGTLRALPGLECCSGVEGFLGGVVVKAGGAEEGEGSRELELGKKD
jgi:hypothetical protein